MSLTGALAAVIAVLVIALGVGGYLLKGQYEKNGALEQSNKSLTEAVAAKVEATKSRVRTNDTVRKMAPADKLERLK